VAGWPYGTAVTPICSGDTRCEYGYRLVVADASCFTVEPIHSDYDDAPERWQTNVEVRRRFAYGDVHAPVAERIVAGGLTPILDVGCGDGELTLPDREAVRDYLVSRLMPPAEAELAADRVDAPVDVTKRGVIVYARRVRP
jgi:hypothetical protein